MTQVVLSNSKFFIPTTITAAALLLTNFGDENQLPADNYNIKIASATEKIWEEQYIPTEPQDEYIEKITIIHQFASTLVNNIEDIPEDFAKVINEDFWDII